MRRLVPTRFPLPLIITVILLLGGCARQGPPQPDTSQVSLPQPAASFEIGQQESVDRDRYVGATIAVFNFENNTPVTGDRMEFLSTWFSTRISETLAEQPAVTLVERNHIKSVLKELDFGTSDLANKAAALELGKLISADYLVFGNYFVLQEQLYCTTRLVEARSGVIVKSDEALSHVDNLSLVIEQISNLILEGLGRKVQAETGSRETPEVAKLYVKGIEAIENGDYEKALVLLTQLLEIDRDNRWARLRIKEILDTLPESTLPPT